jgi:hypothetical protein
MKTATPTTKIQTRSRRALAVCRPLALIAIVSLMPVLARAQVLQSLFSGGAGAIGSVAAAQVNQDQFVTAIVNSGDYLEVIAWSANFQTNTLTRQGSQSAGKVASTYGAAGAIAISSAYALQAGVGGVFTTAMVNAKGNLDISYWTVSTTGTITRIAERQGDPAYFGIPDVSITAVYYVNGYPCFITAMRNSVGDLEVSLWYLDSSNKIAGGGDAYLGPIGGGVSVACLHDEATTAVTAFQNSSGQLELVQWNYSTGVVSEKATITTSNLVSNVALVTGVSDLSSTSFADAFYTSWVNTSNGSIYLTSWSDNLAIDSTAGPEEVSPFNILAANSSTVIMADTPPNHGGAYYLRVFDQIGNGIVTGTYGQAGSAFSISMVDISSLNYVSFAMAYRNGSGNLQIEIWKYTLACSPNCR